MTRSSPRRVAGALAVAVALTALAGSAGEARAFDLCGAAEAAGHALPAANRLDPLVITARGTFDRVNARFRAATRRVTDLHVIGPTAQVDGRPYPPYAAICEVTGQAPRLYLTYTLLELLRKDRVYDESFLAMIVGHELGHRLRDFDLEGRWIAPAWSKEMEEVADAHGAFLAAATGFSTRQLACDDTMNLFLNVEAGVDDAFRQGRKDALAQVLRSFDVYESLYDVGAALMFSERSAAAGLLGWVNAHMDEHTKPIGEFLVLEALARINRAIPVARWRSVTRVPGAPADHLRCAAVFPAHTSLWDERLAGAELPEPVRGRNEDLAQAIELLRRAERVGAHPLPVRSAMACAHFYQGELEPAARALEEARKHAVGRVPAEVRAALGANAALIAWAAWMEQHPAPAEDAPDGERRAWGQRLGQAARGFRGSAELTAWLGRLRAYPTVAAERAGRERPLRCGRAVAVGEGPAILPPLPALPRGGGCPCGWSELHALVDGSDRVTTCIPAGWAVGQRYVHVALPLEGVEQRLVVHDALRGPLSTLRLWNERCDTLEARGVSTDGQRVFVGRCPELGVDDLVLIADPDCRVARAVVFAPGAAP